MKSRMLDEDQSSVDEKIQRRTLPVVTKQTIISCTLKQRAYT